MSYACKWISQNLFFVSEHDLVISACGGGRGSFESGCHVCIHVNERDGTTRGDQKKEQI